MREIRPSGSEGGGAEPNRPSLPLSDWGVNSLSEHGTDRRCSFLRPGCVWVVGDDRQAGFLHSLETKRFCLNTRRPRGLRHGVDASTVVDG
jgi:hypothetical protein